MFQEYANKYYFYKRKVQKIKNIVNAGILIVLGLAILFL